MSSPRFCSECGKPLEAGHRFCTNCGATTSTEADARTTLTGDQTVQSSSQAQSSQPQVSVPADNSGTIASTVITPNANIPGANYSTVPASGDQFYAQTTDVNIIPPPPPPDSFISTPPKAAAAPLYTTTPQAEGKVPVYAQAPKRSRGCLVTSLVLLLVLALGGIGGFYILKHANSGGSNQNGNSSSGQQSIQNGNSNTSNTNGVITPASNGNTPNTGGPVVVPLNLKFTYSSVYITLVSVQQASSFPDDTSLPQGGIRVATRESNPTTSNASFVYSDAVRLVMPDGSVIAPSNEKSFEGPSAGISRDNWIDFPANRQNIDFSKLVLRFGSTNENQMNIPLVAGADLSKYQPKTVTPNSTFQYAGLSWTLASATESLSAKGQQASTGMVYVAVTLKALNSTSNNFSAYPGDYIRLQSGDSKSSPLDFTIPTSIASQSNGSGKVTFSLPQGGNSFALLMLAQQSSPPINAASVSFQIQ